MWFACNSPVALAASRKMPASAATELMVVGAFSLQGFRENVRQFIPRLHFFLVFKVEIRWRTLIPLIRPGSVHSVLRWLWPCVPWQAVCELISWLVPTLCLNSNIVSPRQLCWVKGVCMFRCILPPALLAEWLGSFTCHCSYTGVEQTLSKSQHRWLSLEKKILLPGFELTTFQSWVWCSPNKLSWRVFFFKGSREAGVARK